MGGFLDDVLRLQTSLRDCADGFAEAIIARNYNIARASLTTNLQLEISEMALRAKIENHCRIKASAHGYDELHHPIDFVILHGGSLEAFNQKPMPLEVEHEFSKLVTIEFYPRSNLEFEVFFELCLALVVVRETIRIAHLEIC